MTGIVTENSDISICAEALILLGADPISDFEENNEAARACSNLYASTRDDLLRRHTWNSCIKRQIGSPDANAPAWGYKRRFPLPADCIRLLGVVALPGIAAPGAPIEQPFYTTDYQLEGQGVLTNFDAVGFHYIFRNTNVATWGAGMVRMMVLRMCWALAFPITRDPAIVTMMAQTFAAELRSYKTLDGSENPPMVIADGDYLTSRL